MYYSQNELSKCYTISMKTGLPKRFWLDLELQNAKVSYKKSFFSLKSNEFKKIYNRIINPYLRSKGFSCQGMKGILSNDQFHFMVVFSVYKYGWKG